MVTFSLQGMAAYAIGHLGSLLNSEPKKVAFLGPAFTKALLPIAEALQLFSVPQVRVSCANIPICTLQAFQTDPVNMLPAFVQHGRVA